MRRIVLAVLLGALLVFSLAPAASATTPASCRAALDAAERVFQGDADYSQAIHDAGVRAQNSISSISSSATITAMTAFVASITDAASTLDGVVTENASVYVRNARKCRAGK